METEEKRVDLLELTRKILGATKSDLFAMCRNRGLPTDGSKEALQMILLNSIHNEGPTLGTPKAGPFVLREEVPQDGSDDSDIVSKMDPSNLSEVQTRAAAFMQNMKEILVKKAISLRLQSKIRNPLMLSKTALAETVAANILIEDLFPGRRILPGTPLSPNELASLAASRDEFFK